MLAEVFGVTSTAVVSGPIPYAYTLIRERNELTAGLEDTQVVTNTGRIRVVRPAAGTGVPTTLVPEVRPQLPEHGWRADLETPIPVIVTHEYGRRPVGAVPRPYRQARNGVRAPRLRAVHCQRRRVGGSRRPAGADDCAG